MTELTFRLLISVSVVVTITSIIADEIGAKGLPEPLRSVKAEAKAIVVASSKKAPLIGALRIALILGYLSSLLALALFIPFSPWVYLFFTAAWSMLAVVDAPHIHSRPFVPLYEASLLLNGAILALCFLSPLAIRFT